MDRATNRRLERHLQHRARRRANYRRAPEESGRLQGLNIRACDRYLTARCPRTLTPLASRGGAKVARPRRPGSTTTIAPDVPAQARMPSLTIQALWPLRLAASSGWIFRAVAALTTVF